MEEYYLIGLINIIILLCFIIIIIGIQLVILNKTILEMTRKFQQLSDKENPFMRIIVKNNKLKKMTFEIKRFISVKDECINDMRIEAERQESLICNMSHDLRTPLASLMGYLEAINDKIVPEEIKEQYFQTALKKTYDFKKYLDHLFEYIKCIDGSEKNLKIDWVEITEFTREVLSELMPLLDKNNIELRLDSTNETIKQPIDRIAYQRIFNNIISNSVIHSHCKLIEISILEKEDNIEIIIKDNGIGIGPGEINYIFDRFYKGKDVCSFQGSGLGLGIVKGLVEKLKGEIFIISEHEKFTLVKLVFPKAIE